MALYRKDQPPFKKSTTIAAKQSAIKKAIAGKTGSGAGTSSNIHSGSGLPRVDSGLAIKDYESLYSREQPSAMVQSEDLRLHQSRNSNINSATMKDRQLNRIVHSGGDNNYLN